MPRRRDRYQALVESTPSELSTNSIEYSSDQDSNQELGHAADSSKISRQLSTARPENPIPLMEEFTPVALSSVPINEGSGIIRPQPKRAAEPDVTLELSDGDELEPDEICHCENQSLKTLPPLPETITSLVCHNNQLTELVCRASLREIWANFNRLKLVTGAFQNLRLLEVSDNQLKWIPSIPSLETLACEYNQLTEIPAMPNLAYLYVCNNRLQHIGYCPKLVHADVRKNRLREFVHGNTPALCILWAQDNPITGLQGETFPNLHSCNISRCQVTHFLGEWPNLVMLYCSHNRLTHLEGAPRLSILDCSHNRLTQLPPTFPELLELRCSYNPLKILPAAPSLEILYADHLNGVIIPLYPNLNILES